MGESIPAHMKDVHIPMDCVKPWKETDFGIKSKRVNIQMYSDPFDVGAMRAAYRMLVSGGKTMIAKEFMCPSKRTSANYHLQSHISALAAFLADQFNTLCSPSKKITVIRSPIMSIMQRTKTGKEVETLYNIEEELCGEFKKWCTNGGTILEIDKTVLRFAQWSYEFTDGDVMVADLQGIETAKEYILTDPAILSKNGRYGDGDMGRAGMKLLNEAMKYHLPYEYVTKVVLERSKSKIGARTETPIKPVSRHIAAEAKSVPHAVHSYADEMEFKRSTYIPECEVKRPPMGSSIRDKGSYSESKFSSAISVASRGTPRAELTKVAEAKVASTTLSADLHETKVSKISVPTVTFTPPIDSLEHPPISKESILTVPKSKRCLTSDVPSKALPCREPSSIDVPHGSAASISVDIASASSTKLVDGKSLSVVDSTPSTTPSTFKHDKEIHRERPKSRESTFSWESIGMIGSTATSIPSLTYPTTRSFSSTTLPSVIDDVSVPPAPYTMSTTLSIKRVTTPPISSSSSFGHSTIAKPFDEMSFAAPPKIGESVQTALKDEVNDPKASHRVKTSPSDRDIPKLTKSSAPNTINPIKDARPSTSTPAIPSTSEPASYVSTGTSMIVDKKEKIQNIENLEHAIRSPRSATICPVSTQSDKKIEDTVKPIDFVDLTRSLKSEDECSPPPVGSICSPSATINTTLSRAYHSPSDKTPLTSVKSASNTLDKGTATALLTSTSPTTFCEEGGRIASKVVTPLSSRASSSPSSITSISENKALKRIEALVADIRDDVANPNPSLANRKVKNWMLDNPSTHTPRKVTVGTTMPNQRLDSGIAEVGADEKESVNVLNELLDGCIRGPTCSTLATAFNEKTQFNKKSQIVSKPSCSSADTVIDNSTTNKLESPAVELRQAVSSVASSQTGSKEKAPPLSDAGVGKAYDISETDSSAGPTTPKKKINSYRSSLGDQILVRQREDTSKTQVSTKEKSSELSGFAKENTSKVTMNPEINGDNDASLRSNPEKPRTQRNTYLTKKDRNNYNGFDQSHELCNNKVLIDQRCKMNSGMKLWTSDITQTSSLRKQVETSLQINSGDTATDTLLSCDSTLVDNSDGITCSSSS